MSLLLINGIHVGTLCQNTIMKKKSRKRKASVRSESRAYGRGVLVVHGIGRQKPGETLHAFIKGISSEVSECGIDVSVKEIDTGYSTSQVEVKIMNSPPVLFAEAYWADSIPDLRGISLRRVGRQALALIRMLPSLLAGALAPRVTEPDLLTLETSSADTWEEMRQWGPTFWRMCTFFGLLIGFVLIVNASMRHMWLLIFLSVVGIGALLYILTSDLIGQVRVAALEDTQIQPALGRIRTALVNMESQCNEVWIIAHSQGGYLAHRVLAEDNDHAHPRVKRFTGLASGIRPIRLAMLARDVRSTLAGWLSIVASSMVTLLAVLVFTPGGMFSLSGTFGRIVEYSSRIFVQPGLIFLPGDNDVVTEMLRSVNSQNFVQKDALFLALSVVVILMCSRILRLRKGVAVEAVIPSIPSSIVWEEFTSASDLVGSMSVPPLPVAAKTVIVPGMRNSLIDHLLRSHLGKTGLFRVRIAEVLKGKGRLGKTSISGQCRALEKSLNQLSVSTYRLRGLLFGSALGITLIPSLLLGGFIFTVVFDLYWLYLLVVAAAGGGAAIWWEVGARRRISAYHSKSRIPILVPFGSCYIRLLWGLGFFGVSSGFAIAVAARSLPPENQPPLGGGLILLGAVMLFFACLASASLRPPAMLFLVFLTLLFVVFPLCVSSRGLFDGTFVGVLNVLTVVPGALLGCLFVVAALVTVFYGFFKK